MKTFRWGVAGVVSAGGLWFALHGVDWSAMGMALRHLHGPAWLLLIPLALGGEYALRTERWRLILGEPPSRRGRLFPTVAGAFFLNNVLPFRAGEAARVYWTHRAVARPVGACVAALAVDRLLDMLSVAALLLWAVSSGVGFTVPTITLVLALGAGAGGLMFLLFLARYPERAERMAARCRLPSAAIRFVVSFAEGSRPLRSLPSLAGALALSGGIWGINILLFRIVGGVFALDLSFTQAGWVLGGLALGVALPSTPGFVGTYEAAGVAALSVLGHDKSLSFSFLAVLHVGQIIGSALLGVPSVVSHKSLYNGRPESVRIRGARRARCGPS